MLVKKVRKHHVVEVEKVRKHHRVDVDDTVKLETEKAEAPAAEAALRARVLRQGRCFAAFICFGV